MKILQICNKIPYPPHDGGAIAMLNMAKSFVKAGCQVTIVAMSTSKHKITTMSIPEELRAIIRFIYVDVNTRINPLKLIINLLFSKQPFNAIRFINSDFAAALTDILQSETFEIVQLEGLYLKPYIQQIRTHHKGMLAYRAHNVESEIWYRIASSSKNPFKHWYLNNMAHRLMRFETNMINRYDFLVPISSNDLNWFEAMGNNKPVCLTYTGITNEDFNPPDDTHDVNNMFYIGALDWMPNQEALIWFIEFVWNRIKDKRPNLQFHIAGRNAPERIVRKFKNSAINFHGEIENAHAFMDNHSIMVVPLFAGSGLRIKIVEAMARSKPVITTSIGAQGIEVNAGKEILIANSAEDFIHSIEKLLDDPIYYHELIRNAYTYALHNFNNETIVKNLLYFYRQQMAC